MDFLDKSNRVNRSDAIQWTFRKFTYRIAVKVTTRLGGISLRFLILLLFRYRYHFPELNVFRKNIVKYFHSKTVLTKFIPRRTHTIR